MTDFSRQAFLGAEAQTILEGASIGIVGYGGGGSHLGQQFAHIGIGSIRVFDPDTIEDSNLHRLVGATPHDVRDGRLKTTIAERVVRNVNSATTIETYASKWEEVADAVAMCGIVVGSVDDYGTRDGLERFCRLNLIPYIDIGMDVHKLGDRNYLISGQVIQSLPGHPCLRCCNYITDDKLALEADDYGAAGGRPQVVWPNGVLASTAVGFAINLLCPWSPERHGFRFLSYDGNSGEVVTPHLVYEHVADVVCDHHPLKEVGDPLCDIRSYRRHRRAQVLPDNGCRHGLWARMMTLLRGTS